MRRVGEMRLAEADRLQPARVDVILVDEVVAHGRGPALRKAPVVFRRAAGVGKSGQPEAVARELGVFQRLAEAAQGQESVAGKLVGIVIERNMQIDARRLLLALDRDAAEASGARMHRQRFDDVGFGRLLRLDRRGAKCASKNERDGKAGHGFFSVTMPPLVTMASYPATMSRSGAAGSDL